MPSPSSDLFDQPLTRARLIRRYKRFLADVELADGETVTVHCPNPGRMTSCSEPGSEVLLSRSDQPSRKYPLTLEMVRVGATWVGVHPARANGVVRALIVGGHLDTLRGYVSVRNEVVTVGDGRSRIDLLLEAPGRRRCWVEVKSTTLRVPGPSRHAAFPDAPTARGRRHLAALVDAVVRGDRAVLVLFVARDDVERFRPADEIDPEYGSALRQAVTSGVEVAAFRMRYRPDGVDLDGPLPVDLDVSPA